jgi:hypothetical protein
MEYNTQTAQPTMTYFDMQVREFYTFLSAVLCEWAGIRQHSAANPENPHNGKTFVEYLCYRMYGEFGIKRKLIRYGAEIPDYSQLDTLDTHPDKDTLLASGADTTVVLANVKSGNAFTRAFYGKTSHLLIQFFYDKSIMAYAKGQHPVTQLCRHMVFDMNTLSIVSMGVTKSLDYETFSKHMELSENKGHGIRVEEFREGTMVVYNRLLGQLNQEKMMVSHAESAEETTAQEDAQRIATAVKKQRSPADFAIATRRKIGGTGYFNNPGKTFQQMFTENNQATGTNLDTPALDPYVLVFNVEHVENRIVSPHITNQNTLVAAYRLGDRDKALAIVRDLQQAVFNSAYADIGMITQALADVQLRSVTELSALVDTLKKEHTITGIRTPTSLFMFNGQDVREGMTKTFIDAMDQYCPGLMLKDHSGTIRGKIRNPKYSALLEIKGTHPITISQSNNRNLFKLFWSLHQRDLCNDGSATPQFLAAFDSPESSQTPYAYAGLFNWYASLVSTLSYAIYSEYQSVFVRHNKTSAEIPFALKPPCCDLHKIYLQNRTPTSLLKVSEFVSKMPYFQIYWRIFGLETDN